MQKTFCKKLHTLECVTSVSICSESSTNMTVVWEATGENLSTKFSVGILQICLLFYSTFIFTGNPTET